MNVEREPISRGKEIPVDSLLKRKEIKISPEVECWIQKVEKNVHTQRPVVTNSKGQPILFSTKGQPVKISLPLTKAKFSQGLKQGVDEAVRWLSEWCYKAIKKDPKQVVFKQSIT
jgi:hypothetical protein